ncbi:DUF2520 domain-containing protein [Ascidiimonas aurantiaca]|uniref:Rossmann-like and DUF2520 domain-containing protein n=1 Tax=Ascidiimonas aurantiaca TaxID=1685432 RepID=UPI0030EE487D
MIRLVILGSGNVAWHLIKACKEAQGIEVIQLWHRGELPADFDTLQVETTSSLSLLAEADLYFIAVNDAAITNLSKSMPKVKGVVAHTSGNTPMQALSSKNRRGVFYPLQTFSKSAALHFKEVPVCLEAEDTEGIHLLVKTAQKLTNHYEIIDSDQRKTLHLAAVIVNNLVNHLYHQAHELCRDKEIPFSLLQPLILETARKINTKSPYDAQTGPARRGDHTTLYSQIDTLTENSVKELYIAITQSILKTYGREKL